MARWLGKSCSEQLALEVLSCTWFVWHHAAKSPTRLWYSSSLSPLMHPTMAVSRGAGWYWRRWRNLKRESLLCRFPYPDGSGLGEEGRGSATPLSGWYENCTRSWAYCPWGLRRLRKSFNVVIICEVSATGQNSFSSLGWFFFGTRTMWDVFQRVGTLPPDWVWSSVVVVPQFFSSLEHTLSGPAAFLGRTMFTSEWTLLFK